MRCCGSSHACLKTSSTPHSPAYAASELVFQRGTPPEAAYFFKHALVQDTAYGSLLRGPRRQLHARIAEALETHSPELAATQPERLAQHYAEAGLAEKSFLYWGKQEPSHAPVLSGPRLSRNSKMDWTSWRCCPTTQSANGES